MSRIRISNGRIIDPASRLDQVTDLYVVDGRIAAIGEKPADFRPDSEIDATGQLVCPGLIDLCARTREPGEEPKGTIASETAAAASTGITTLVCPPDTDPVIDTPAVIELIRQRNELAGKARILPIGALTQDLNGEALSEMAALKAAGAVGISNADRPLTNTLAMMRALEYAATFDMTVFLRPEDPALRDDGLVHEGPSAPAWDYRGIPDAAETVAVARDLALIERSGIRAHFCRLSSARSVRLIARAQHDGLPVTADVAAHQLFLTEMDVMGFNSNCHVYPPLRTQRDRDALREAVAEGVVSVICSDHQPHEPDAKLAPLGETEAGIAGLETLLPLTLRLVDEGVIDLMAAIARLTAGPAGVLRRAAGTLTPGNTADICLIDPEVFWTLTPERLRGRGHNTPFIGWEFRGQVTHTLLNGRIVYQRNSS
ncbi:MAG: dihydroorotase [Pseudomonadota bacterium]|nr:MAG: dihydroorotase [Pseudomonadota bacterium]